MDRVFKRVAEGCAVFDGIYNKLMNASNQSQKEKLEGDLKREIKKLQKLRDQIKTWIASNDVRDKKQLMEQRRIIESDMERFKVVEREIKTKAYSKEGLSRANDPYAKEKQEAVEFLQTKTEELEQQVEELEDEQESLQNTTKKGKKDAVKQERLSDIDHFVERDKWHISQMEIMMSMIENDKLAPESVMELQEDINYYVESNQEVDFAEDEAIYDELNLVGEDQDEIVETIVRDDTYTLEDLAQDLSKEAAKEAAQKERDFKEKDKPKPKTSLPSTPASLHSQSLASQVSSQSSTPTHRETPQPPSLSEVFNGGKTPSPRRSQSPATPGLNPLPAPSVPAPKVSEPVKRGAHLAQGGATAPTPMPVAASRSTSVSKESANSPQTSRPSVGLQTQQAHAAQSNLSQAAQNAADIAQASAPPGLTRQSTPSPAVSTSSLASTSESKLDIKYLPPGLQDLVYCFDAAKQRLSDPESAFRVPSVAKLVNDSFLNTPDAIISDQPRYYHPQNPYPTPDYYPQEALASLEDPLVFREMHVDTVFYVFYYCQNTHQQYLAAKELKSRSWRFHKQFLTWFQRQEDPEVITPEYEEGTYRFFDFEGSWVQRRKSNFKFEFKYLENEI